MSLMNIREFLNAKVQDAMTEIGIPGHCKPLVAPSKKVEFGDYQANGAMGAAKVLKKKPRDIAQEIIERLSLEGVADRIEVAGPGFINIYLKTSWLSSQLVEVCRDPSLGLFSENNDQTVVIDYSGPNLAKEMHVGHLRSTIIGDSLAKTLEFIGHKVIRQNHVGDWGTQFGMLIAELEETLSHSSDATLALQDLETFYQQAKKHFDLDEAFAQKARDYVVKLQSGDPDILKLWEKFREVSLTHSEEIYEKLQVSLTRQDVKGESAYNHDLPILVNALVELGLAKEDQSALVVFLDELADKKGNPSPVIVQKKGGGYLYATTDLAGLRYRAGELKANRIMYFIDSRQSLHMQQVFTIAKKAKFVPESISLEHHGFGTMNGEDGKPFKTRTGGTVKLAALIDEAVQRAHERLNENESNLSPEERLEVARKVGIGAVKYADLSKTRTNDYIFNWDSMLSFEGNTAPYLQYAYTRIRSIFRKAGLDDSSLRETLMTLQSPEERALAVKILQLSEVIDQVVHDAYPHVLCHYLYELSSLFMSFYEACPILKEDVEEKERLSRLKLCEAVTLTLKIGLDLLGIEVMEKM